jgi:hypothetical protein
MDDAYRCAALLKANLVVLSQAACRDVRYARFSSSGRNGIGEMAQKVVTDKEQASEITPGKRGLLRVK